MKKQPPSRPPISPASLPRDERMDAPLKAPRSHREEALQAIQALGARANMRVPLGAISQFDQWLDRPSWLRAGTSHDEEGPLPRLHSLADDIIMTANILENADSEALLERVLKVKNLFVGPIGELIAHNAPSLGASLSVMQNSINLWNPHLTLSYVTKGNRAVVAIMANVSMPRLLDFAAALGLITVLQRIESLVSDEPGRVELALSHPSPKLGAIIQAGLCEHVTVGQSSNELSFPVGWTKISNPNRDPGLWLLAQELLAEADRRSNDDEAVMGTRRYVAEMLQEKCRVPRLKQIASDQEISERTLIRRLNSSGLNFHTLVEQERRLLAAKLINDPSFSLAEIAEATGFPDSSSFGRSFRRWFGEPPGHFRSELPR